MIQLKNIRKSYQTAYTNLEVLKGIDLEIEAGDFVSIMGSSGSGKSTLLNILGILDEYNAGSYHLDGTLIKDLNQKQAAYYRYQKVDRKKRHELAVEYLDRVGLKDWADHLPSQMSGGQQQRVAIARALITQPKVILADEPTGALDSKTSYDVMELFKQVNNEGITCILVTHENDIAENTKRVIHLKDGMIEHNTVQSLSQ